MTCLKSLRLTVKECDRSRCGRSLIQSPRIALPSRQRLLESLEFCENRRTYANGPTNIAKTIMEKEAESQLCEIMQIKCRETICAEKNAIDLVCKVDFIKHVENVCV